MALNLVVLITNESEWNSYFKMFPHLIINAYVFWKDSNSFLKLDLGTGNKIDEGSKFKEENSLDFPTFVSEN